MDNFVSPVNINENNIIQWAERYYCENPDASLGDFLREIRSPNCFKGLINPFTDPYNEKILCLLDCLNKRLHKKDFGTFYTPEAYCNKAAELVETAVSRVPEGNDYIILDRCAGTGNLEKALYNRFDRNGDELISHCVVSTYGYDEYIVLLDRIGNDVRMVIPPENETVPSNGKIISSDALTEEFISSHLLKKYIDDPLCTIILFENPPYSDSSSITFTENDDVSKRAGSSRRDKFAVKEFKRLALPYLNERLGAARESSNIFIWSGVHYYMRYPTDSCIFFSPVKYFKNIGLPKKKMLQGFAFNRKYFHATDSVISCILWSAEDDMLTDEWKLSVFDIIGECAEICTDCPELTIRMSHKSISAFNDKRCFEDDTESWISCNPDGTEYKGRQKKPSVYNENIIAYIAANGYTPDVKHRYLLRCGYKTGIEQSFGFFLRRDNFLFMLPLWTAKMFPQEKWFEKDIYNNTSDGGDAYTKDNDFLKACLIFTCLSNQNKCLSFTASDGRFYRNELCFDTTNGQTAASSALDNFSLDSDEQQLMAVWHTIIEESRKTSHYSSKITYGIHQISTELNTFIIKGNKKIYDYPMLNSALSSLRLGLRQYYNTHITEKLFIYELIK